MMMMVDEMEGSLPVFLGVLEWKRNEPLLV
jgi:hypothetical protein